MAIATTSLSTISNILKTVYDNKEVTTLNNEDKIMSILGSRVIREVGDGYKITVHVSRNNSGSNMTEGGSFPNPEVQGRVRLTTTTKEWGSSGGITFKALNSAKSMGKAAIMSAIQAEVEPALTDAKQAQCKLMSFGGPSRGLIWQKKAFTQATNAANTIAGAIAGVGVTSFEYDGDYSPFLSASLANPASWVPITLVRNDRDLARAYKAFAAGSEVTLAGGVPATAAFQFYVTSASQATRSINIGLVCDGTGGTADCTTDPVTVGVTLGFAISVQLDAVANPVAAVATGTVAVNSLGNPLATAEQSGLLTNLTTTTHFGVDRSGAIPANGGAQSLQSWIWSMSTGTPGARAAWDPSRVDFLIANIHNVGGGEPDLMLMNRLTHHTIITTIQQTSLYNFDNGERKDIGPKTTAVLGYTPEFSQHIPQGLVYFLKKDGWQVLELDTLHFVQFGGGQADDRLLLNMGKSSYVFELYRDWEFQCPTPHYQGVICGLSL